MRGILPALNEANASLLLRPHGHAWPLLTYLVSRPKDLGDDEFFCWKTKTRASMRRLHKTSSKVTERRMERNLGGDAATPGYMWHLKKSDAKARLHTSASLNSSLN